MDFDENKLQQILINLLSNAINFTPDYGSVKVTASKVVEQADHFLELAVTDTGKGIPEDQLPYIFDRFFQVENSAMPLGGSGIGLALVKELVELFKGNIRVESKPGKGSTFLVFLPIHQKANIPVSPEPRIPKYYPNEDQEYLDRTKTGSVTSHNDKPQILIIEDNADVAEYIASCLFPDYLIQSARDGIAGLAKALESIPDLVLCDVMMPEMDGFEVCKKLKTDRRTSHIPVVLLTAKATQEDKITGLDHGADAYLTKPFDREELLIRLRNLAQLSKQIRKQLTQSTILPDQSTGLESREAIFLQELHQIIDSNLDNEQFDTLKLCRTIAMSRTQLHRKLKALTGQSTASYIRSFRLKKAKSLLETTDLPIGEIAFQVGYKDFSHFSRSFAKKYGMSPSEART